MPFCKKCNNYIEFENSKCSNCDNNEKDTEIDEKFNLLNDLSNKEQLYYQEIYKDLNTEEIKALSWFKISNSFHYIGKLFKLWYVLSIIIITIYSIASLIAIILLITGN